MVTPLEVTGTAQRDAWDQGVMPPVEQVQPGLWSIPVPIPNNPLRYVLVYLFEVDRGAVVVDTGWNTEDAWEALTSGMHDAGYAPADVRGALITHIHPDHYGLAGRLREASGGWVGLHPADAALLPGRYGAGIPEVIRDMQRLLRSCGVPEQDLDELSGASMGIKAFVDLALPDLEIEPGRRLPLEGWNLTAVHTPGHSPGHVCFVERDRRLLLAGDHVLPRITPNIAVHAQQPGNPLADFLESLRGVRDLEVDEVLPAHQWRFRPLSARVDALIRHHEDRLDAVLAVLAAAGSPTCWEVTKALPWSRPWDQISGFMRRAALGETLAHLVLLCSDGLWSTVDSVQLHALLDSADPVDGVACLVDAAIAAGSTDNVTGVSCRLTEVQAV
ncbi:MAG: MBL fold metallo-hydrolase [Candidatus Dormibacteria bacterium]